MNLSDWHPWFAWWPVRVTYIPVDPEGWWRGNVWLRWVERRIVTEDLRPAWQYRLSVPAHYENDIKRYTWHPWFAWRRVLLVPVGPAFIPGKTARFRWVERRVLRDADLGPGGRDEGDTTEYWEYRMPL